MALPQSSGRIRVPQPRNGFLLLTGFAMVFAFSPSRSLAQSQPAAQSSSQAPASLASENLPVGSPDTGKALFAGKVRFHNGGPPCASCHSIAGLAFPNGGTLGPDLTGVYGKLGPQGMQTAMKTLYFHVMAAIYDPHPLTLSERADLVAFFKQAETQPKPRLNTQIVALIAFVGFLILVSITHFAWQDRLKSVRRKMVERAIREGRTYP